LPPLNGAVLYHSLLFACQRALHDSGGDLSYEQLMEFFEEYLGKPGLQSLEDVETEDTLVTLENLGELLVESNLIGSFQVIPTETGFRFVAERCVFAGNVHSCLEPRDVTCPYGMLAIYLAGKGGGTASGGSNFTDLDSDTRIEVTRAFARRRAASSRKASRVES